jgi:FLVCR family feline leukemia virus subgroup C receptor-related protein
MLSKFILIIIFCIPGLFVEKDNPDIPPSPSQSKENLKKHDFTTSLKMLLSNINFIFLLIATFFFVGYYYSLATSINNLLELYGISRKQSTYIFGLSSCIGIISSVTISFILDKFKKFKLYMSILCIVGIVFQVFLTFLLELSRTKGLNGYAIGMVFYSLINATVIPFYTVGMNYACEITYPVGESINGGFMMVMTQLFGIIGTFLFDHLIKNNKEKPWISNLISLIFFVISTIFTFLFDKKLKRSEIDIEGRLKEEADEKASKKSNEDNHNQVDQVEVEIKQN